MERVSKPCVPTVYVPHYMTHARGARFVPPTRPPLVLRWPPELYLACLLQSMHAPLSGCTLCPCPCWLMQTWTPGQVACRQLGLLNSSFTPTWSSTRMPGFEMASGSIVIDELRWASACMRLMMTWRVFAWPVHGVHMACAHGGGGAERGAAC